MSKFIPIYAKNSEGDDSTSFVNVDLIRLIIPERNRTRLVFDKGKEHDIILDEYIYDFVDRLSKYGVYFDANSEK